MQTSRRGTRLAAALAACAALAVGCSSGQETSSGTGGAKKSGTVEIALLQKQGDQQYFVDEANGARAKATQLGDVKISVADLGLDANKAVDELDASTAQGADGVIIVVPDQQVGPQVIDSAKNAGIPLVAADDVIVDSANKPAAFVGFDGTKMGQAVGKEAAQLYKASGWKPADTRIISAWKQDLSVCTDRVKGSKSAFQGSGAAMPKILEVGTDNTPTGAQDKTGAVITANQGVKHWIVWGCNDENVSGVVTALQNSGVSPDDIIGVALGGYLACKPWQAHKATGMKAALFIDGRAVGASAVQVMVDHLRDGKPLPPETIAPTKMVTPDDWQQSGLKCT